jgi:hypothetical protein
MVARAELAPRTSLPGRLAGTAKAPRDLSQRLIWPAIALWLTAKGWLTFTRYFNADEFECLHIGWLLHQGKRLFVDFKANHPPLVFEALSLLNYVTSDPLTLLLLARVARFVCNVLVFWLVWRIARDVFGPRAARWAAIVFATSAICLEYSTQVRVDMFMLPLWLGGIAVLVDRAEWNGSRRLLCAGLLAGLAFCANQKVVLLGIPCALFALIGCGEGRLRLRDILIGLAGALLPVGFYLAKAAHNGTLSAFLSGVFATGADLVSEGGYAGEEWDTIQAGLTRDGGLLLLTAAALLWGARRWRRLDRRQWFVLISCPWLCATLFMTPCPLTYYLECLFPLFAVLVGGFLASRHLNVPMMRRKRAAMAFVCLLWLALPGARLVELASNFAISSMDFQRQVIRLGTELTDGHHAVFDGAGTTIVRPDAYGFHWVLWKQERALLHTGQMPRIIPELRKNECRLLIETWRIGNLPEPERSELWRHFVQLWGPVFVPGFDSLNPVGEEETEFELWYDGTYELDPPRLVIDAVERKDCVNLTAGRHKVRVPGGSARVQIREASYRKRLTLPEHPAPSLKMVP